MTDRKMAVTGEGENRIIATRPEEWPAPPASTAPGDRATGPVVCFARNFLGRPTVDSCTATSTSVLFVALASDARFAIRPSVSMPPVRIGNYLQAEHPLGKEVKTLHKQNLALQRRLVCRDDFPIRSKTIT